MGFLKTSLFITFICFISFIQQTHAKNTPQLWVAAHNSVRSPYGLPLVHWNTDVAAFAKAYAANRSADCALVHSDGPLGENLAYAAWDLTAAESVKMWADEVEFYNYDTNSCKDGEECGHYTQLVWHDSVNIGCATVKCRNTGWTYVSCNYDPPGNYDGERPY